MISSIVCAVIFCMVVAYLCRVAGMTGAAVRSFDEGINRVYEREALFSANRETLFYKQRKWEVKVD